MNRCLYPVALVAVITGAAATVHARQSAPAANESPVTKTAVDDSVVKLKDFPVSSIVLRYLQSDVSEPTIDQLQDVVVLLAVENNMYVEPRANLIGNPVRIGDIGSGDTKRIEVNALRSVAMAVVQRLSRAGFVGIDVVPDEVMVGDENLSIVPASELSGWADQRASSDTVIRLVVVTYKVSQVRTIDMESNDPSDPERKRIDPPDNPVHARIARNSPIHAGDSLRGDLLDGYLARLNRHPGRRVDVALGASDRPGDAVLDYLVSERDPFLFYGQISNTGTKQTNEWRERFGIINNQVSGRDDIFQIDYSTAGFDSSHALQGSYQIPVSEDLTLKAFGSVSRFDASEVGAAQLKYRGDSWEVGSELQYSLYQHKNLFVDLVGGARYEYVSTEERTANSSSDTKGESGFLIPYLQLRAERETGASVISGSLTIDWGNANNQKSPERLGRLNADSHWLNLKFDVGGSFYIEPLLSESAWAGMGGDGPKTLAHELAGGIRGQYAFNNRLIPNEVAVVGGLSTVRGYPEAVSAGDNVIIATAEYRFHVPRAFPIATSDQRAKSWFGSAFRAQPWEPFGRTDWDFILRAFVDVGRTSNSRRETFEANRTLVGAGVGAEFQLKSNVSVRLDLGVPLRSVTTGTETVKSGDTRLHVMATLSF